MKENDALFITSHAVLQFQKRIAPLDDGAARRMILKGIFRSRNVGVLPDGATVRVRTRRPFPFEFRAYLVFDKSRGHRVVTTIVRGDSNVTRKLKRIQRASTMPARSASNFWSAPPDGGALDRRGQ